MDKQPRNQRGANCQVIFDSSTIRISRTVHNADSTLPRWLSWLCYWWQFFIRMEDVTWNDTNEKKPKDGQLCALANEFHHGLEDTGLGYYRKKAEEFEDWEGSTYWWRYWFPLPELPEDA